ncbi:MAG: TonB-dependent receptor [Gemmatimonadetes bacterium]|jgi:iron complex outermembrane receptor protein|nr:TonB-dependent receptor [Gemmatimonadota bacterium]
MTPCLTTAGRALRAAAALALLAPVSLAAQRQNGLLVGRVLSGDVAVPSATIYVSGGRVTLARVDGRFRMSLPAGRYEVRAQRLGYATSRDSVTIAAGQTVISNFRLERGMSALETVATVGTRGYERSVIDVPQAVEVVMGPALRATGRMQTSRALQALAPSIAAPRGSVAEGSDVIHPVTLRGMGPDQLLVLVNGRRRHSSALLNVNGTVGRGSTGVDLDAIPASTIERIEVLRGNAAAQYGGDAVAGVINVVLKSGVHGDAVSMVGGNATTYNRQARADVPGTPPGAERSVRDGRSVQASIDKGVVFGERGFLHGDIEYRERAVTNRALPDPRVQYPAGDPRFPQTGVTQDAINNQAGDPAGRDLAVYLNGGNLFASGLELYGNVGGARRTIEAASLFRRAVDPVTDRRTNPNGFLPIIRPIVDDNAGTLGLRGTLLDDWRYDAAATYGYNLVDYGVLNTQSSDGTPGAQFDAGSVRATQRLVNLDLYGTLPLFDELRVATGGEFRREGYRVLPTTGTRAIEGFAGFGPGQGAFASRTMGAAYLDLETDLVPSLLLGMAGRVERYSDVGSLPSFNVTMRYEPSRRFALRAAAGRGERAPSLAQTYYGNVATEPGPGGIASRVAAVSSPEAIAAGATELRPEQNRSLSAGLSVAPTRTFSLSADVYRIQVDDRVTLLQSLSDVGAPDPYFSANAADTRTTGIDVAAHYGIMLNSRGSLRLMTGLNAHRTEVLRAVTVGALGLGRTGIERIEHGQPSSTFLASAAYAQGAVGALLRTQRFGEVRVAGLQGGASQDQRFGARFVTDANLSYTMLRKYTFTAGADNLLDVYPDRHDSRYDPATNQPGNSYFGILPYSAVSPFGFSGRFVYGRLSIYL